MTTLRPSRPLRPLHSLPHPVCRMNARFALLLGGLFILTIAATLAKPRPADAQDLSFGAGPALSPTRVTGVPDLRADGTPLPVMRDVIRPAAARGTVTLTPSPQIDAGDEAATLLADQVRLTGPRSLVAEGDVVIWYQTRRLIARRIIYDGAADRVQVEGPIHLSTPADEGSPREMVLVANSADLDTGLGDGILRGARLVLAQQMQMAANEARIEGDGRYVTLDHVVASSCRICAEDPTPLWEIRARRITHDRQAHRIHYDRPQLRAFGMPVATLPWLITPDPTVDRMTGLLTPRFRTTSGLGTGIKLPFFVTLGDSADVTLTPYLSTARTKTLEARYRQAFRNGVMTVDGAISRDTLRRGSNRAYLFAAGAFDLPRDWLLEAQLQLASGRSYLLDYGITDADRLWSGVMLSRVKRDRIAWARAGRYRTLREDENSATTPREVADLFWQRRFEPAGIGGTALLEWSAHAHRRPSRIDQDGRDTARLSFAGAWSREYILPAGVLAETGARLDADFYQIMQDSRYAAHRARLTPAANLTLRWPLLRPESGGASQILEPVAQLVWSPPHRSIDDLPNEDSLLWEFDEGNLFSLSRYPGHDARETGLRANLGISWTRFDPQGWSLSLAAGRVIRHRAMTMPAGEPLPVFGKKRGDWLLSANFANDSGVALAGRALLDDSASLSRAELRAGVLRPQMRLSAGYLWIDADAEPGQSRDISELVLETGVQLAPGWWANGEARYDFTENRAQRAAIGLTWRNECVTLDLGIERRFVDAANLRRETSLDLSIRLGGFGGSVDAANSAMVARRACLR